MLQVQGIDAVDPDGDPLTFQYDWHVNGRLVQSTTSTTATLDLSQPGSGDRGDLIEVFVTVSDGYASGSAVTSVIVTAAPTELYADYLAAAKAALVVYQSGVANAEAVLLAAQDAAYKDNATAIAPVTAE